MGNTIYSINITPGDHTDPKEGYIKIYIDDNEEAVLDMPFKDFFDNTKLPFNFPELVYTTAKGHNNYVPITFQKSCKVTLSGEWGGFYHVTYGEFPEVLVFFLLKGNLMKKKEKYYRKSMIN